MPILSIIEDLSGRTFEQKWVIKNWENVLPNKILLESTTTEMECRADDLVYAKFEFGFKTSTNLQFYWKLLHKHFDNVQVFVVIEALNKDGITWSTFMSEASAAIGRTMDIDGQLCAYPYNSSYNSWVNSERAMVNSIKLTLKNLPVEALHSEEDFKLASRNELCKNLAALADDKLSSDVKIFSKDHTELFAHKAILCARCPVFSSMFGSVFLESGTNVVKIDDISAKTMKILLHYWYTGELLPSWKDNDTVVEFTYAAGKYQMIEVLKMLDKLLRHDLKTSDVDVELLKVVQQLSLKNAEARILKLVVHKINQAKSGEELLDVFSLSYNNLDEGSTGVSQVLKAFDDVLAEKK